MKDIVTTLSVQEFQEAIRPILRQEISAVLKQIYDGDEILGQKEVCEILKISAQSVIAWGKKGTLKPIKIESKVYYLKSDIDQLLKERKSSMAQKETE